MRILWLAPNGGNYNSDKIKGTGGWIGALQGYLNRQYPDLEIGIVFGYSESAVVKEGSTTYFPVRLTPKGKYANALAAVMMNERKREWIWISNVKDIISSYKPDVVHVWGVENTYAAVIPYLTCPFVVHIQGLMSLYIHAYLPPSFSLSDIKHSDPFWHPKTWVRKMMHISEIDKYIFARYRAKRELTVSRYVKNWIGRTEWDMRASKLLSSNSNYFHCDEIMRDDFKGEQWGYHFNGEVLKIQSSISEPLYKGVDVVLKTAKLLKEHGLKLEWNVYGISNNYSVLKLFTHHLGIKPEEVGVNFLGHVDGETIRSGLMNCDVYVHPAYIENSSNAIAEAMLLGVPTIAQNVGGNSSMLKENSGLLISPNEPYMLASAILEMKDKATATAYGQRAYAVAGKRQNPQAIVDNLVNIYTQLR